MAGAAFEFAPPEPIERLLTVMSGSAAPCALFALGVTVASRQLKRVPLELPVLILVKLALHPALVLAILHIRRRLRGSLGGNGGADGVAAAGSHHLRHRHAIRDLCAARLSAILIGTAASVFTVTGVLYLITHDLLPTALFGR